MAYDMAAVPKLPLMGLLQLVPDVLSLQLMVSTCGPPATGTDMLPVQVEMFPARAQPGESPALERTSAQMPPWFGFFVTSPFGGAPGAPKSTFAVTPTVQSLSSFT